MDLKSKIYNSLKEKIFNSSTVTDNERHAMALMSLGINPYSGTSVNYIKKIVDSFSRKCNVSNADGHHNVLRLIESNQPTP